MKSLFNPLLFLFLTTLSQAETWNGKATIQFDGTSTLHDWGGKVDTEPFKADVTFNGDKPQKIVSQVVVKAANMDTDDAKRDENMDKAMKIAAHPLIQANIDSDFADIAPSGLPQKLPLSLTLLGKAQKVNGTLTNWKQAGNSASFDLEFDLSLKKSGITVPSVLLFIKVGDTIKVRASVTLKRS